jgi:hypothetical protein
MFREKEKKQRLIFLFLISFCFIITLFIKLHFFFNYFINIDSAFYVKWFNDLSLASNFFPQGDYGFYNNLIVDQNSFMHQLTRRYFNNFSEVYTFFPTIINYLLIIFIKPGFTTFNFGSIFISSLIPFVCCYNFLKKLNLRNLDNLIAVIFIYLLFLSNFSLFNLSPLGIHNYSLFFLTLSFFIIKRNYEKDNFFNFNLITFAILIPCFSHKFNVPIIFLTLFLTIITRKFYAKNLKKELILLMIIFILIISPLFIGLYLSPKNIEFLNTFFSESQNFTSNKNNFFLDHVENQIKIIQSSVFKLIENYYYNLGTVGMVTFLISFYKSDNRILKFFLISNILIFIFLPVSNFSLRTFNYQLIIVFMIICEYFIKSLINKKNIINRLFLLITSSFIVLCIYNTFLASNFNKYEKEMMNVYYKDNHNLKDSISNIFTDNQIDTSNIIFGNYLSKDLFYSYAYEFSDLKQIDSFPAINNLWNNKKNIIYLNTLKIDFKKLKNSHLLYIYRFDDNDLENKYQLLNKTIQKICDLRSLNLNNCDDLLKYENKIESEFFYTGFRYSLNLIKFNN